MSVEAMSWVFKHSPYEHDARLVHLAIADVANEDHDWRVWISQAAIAAKAHVSIRTVGNALGQMVLDGYLTLVERAPGRPVVYRFETPAESSGPQIDAGDPRRMARPTSLTESEQKNSSEPPAESAEPPTTRSASEIAAQLRAALRSPQEATA